MTRPRFLADENLRLEIVLATRRVEPAVEIVTAVEAACGGFTDPQLLDFAAKEMFLIVSHDVRTMKRFAEERIQNRLPMLGLFIAPQIRATPIVAESLILIWAASDLEEWNDRIVFLPF